MRLSSIVSFLCVRVTARLQDDTCSYKNHVLSKYHVDRKRDQSRDGIESADGQVSEWYGVSDSNHSYSCFNYHFEFPTDLHFLLQICLQHG